MEELKKVEHITDDIIIDRIYQIRGKKVMLDADLAEIYGVETKALKQQVRRNLNRFPEHFMFELTREEAERSRSQNATLKRGANLKYLPFAFTEHGLMMLANVLKSERAIAMSIRIIDIFIFLRDTLLDYSELRVEFEKMKGKLNNQGMNIELIFQYIDEIMDKQTTDNARPRIGYLKDG